MALIGIKTTKTANGTLYLKVSTNLLEMLYGQVRMVEDDLMYSTFLEVYENHCSRNDREADLPITYFKEQLNQAISGQISPEAVVDLRLQAYNEITKNLVTDNIFSQYMYKTLPSGNHTWAFKKQFAIQLALSSFMSFMLQIGGRSPNKILFAKNTGKIFQTDFHPAYDANGLIEFNEPVPFRLTRNMQAFFSHGVEGLIVSSMCAAAQAVASPKVRIEKTHTHTHTLTYCFQYFNVLIIIHQMQDFQLICS